MLKLNSILITLRLSRFLPFRRTYLYTYRHHNIKFHLHSFSFLSAIVIHWQLVQNSSSAAVINLKLIRLGRVRNLKNKYLFHREQ